MNLSSSHSPRRRQSAPRRFPLAVDSTPDRAERWLYALILATTLLALGLHARGTHRFVLQLPEFAQTVRLWLGNAV